MHPAAQRSNRVLNREPVSPWLLEVISGVRVSRDRDLEPFYGTRAPWGGLVFVRLRPPAMGHHGAMHGM